MPQHLQMTRIKVKGFAMNSSMQISITQCSCDSRLVSQPSRSSVQEKQNSLDALQCFTFLGGIIKQLSNAGHGSE